MEKRQLLFYYMMLSAGFMLGRIQSFGREIIEALVDLMVLTAQFGVLAFLVYVVIISLDRAKKRIFIK